MLKCLRVLVAQIHEKPLGRPNQKRLAVEVVALSTSYWALRDARRDRKRFGSPR
jgi:hypothetical protein